MKVNIALVQKAIGARQSFSFLIPADALAGGQEIWLTGKVAVEGEIVNTGRYLQVTGIVRAQAGGQCGRCLADFSVPVSIPFAEEYRESGQAADADDLSVFAGEELELGPLIREAVVLAEPMLPLCSEDCRGICQQCGANLNEKTCGCETRSIDPRLAALGKLLEKK